MKKVRDRRTLPNASAVRTDIGLRIDVNRRLAIADDGGLGGDAHGEVLCGAEA
jgi:hypothetical protein